jgi:hypothetical protein
MTKKNSWNKIITISLIVMTPLILTTLGIFSLYPIHYGSTEFHDFIILKTWPLSFLEEQKKFRKKLRIYPKSDKKTRLESQNRRIHQLRTTIFDPFWQGYKLTQGPQHKLPTDLPYYRPLKRTNKKGEILKGLSQVFFENQLGHRLLEAVFLSHKTKLSFEAPKRIVTRYLRFDLFVLKPGQIKLNLGGFTEILKFETPHQFEHCDIPIHENRLLEVSLMAENGKFWFINPEITITNSIAKSPIHYKKPWSPHHPQEPLDPETQFNDFERIADPLEYQRWTSPEKSTEFKALGYNLIWIQMPPLDSKKIQNPLKDIEILQGGEVLSLKKAFSREDSFTYQILKQQTSDFDLSTLSLSLSQNEQNFYKRLRHYGYFVGSISKVEDVNLRNLFLQKMRKDNLKNWSDNEDYQSIDWKANEQIVLSHSTSDYTIKQLYNAQKWLNLHQKKRFALHLNFDPHPGKHYQTFQTLLSSLKFSSLGKFFSPKQDFQSKENFNKVLKHLFEDLHGLYIHHRTIVVVQAPLAEDHLAWIKMPGLAHQNQNIKHSNSRHLTNYLLDTLGIPMHQPKEFLTFTKFKLSTKIQNFQSKGAPLTLIWNADELIDSIHTQTNECFDLLGPKKFIFWPFSSSGLREITWYQKSNSFEKELFYQPPFPPSISSQKDFTTFMGGSLEMSRRGDHFSSFENCFVSLKIGEHFHMFDPLLQKKLNTAKAWSNFYEPLSKLKLINSSISQETSEEICRIAITLHKSFIKIPS